MTIRQALRNFLEKKYLRVYQIYILVSLGLTGWAIYEGRFSPTESFRADGWAQMSITIGASILTLVAIIASIVLSNENNKRIEMVDNLATISKKIEEKEQNNPDKSLSEIYDQSKLKLAEIIDTFSPLKFTVSLIGIMSFWFFLASAVFAIWSYQFNWIIGSFLVGINLLGGYVIYIAEEFVTMDKVSSPKKKKGELTLQDVRINGVHREFEQGKKELWFTVGNKVEKMEFKLRFKGNVRNGFLHATVYHSNGIAYVPDRNTYLANFGFRDDFGLTLIEEFDTGVLYLSEKRDFHFELLLRSKKESEENPPIAKKVPVGMLGEKDLYKHCSIPENISVNSIELRMWEDPLYKPNFKRREVDCITLKIGEIPKPT